MNDLVWWADGTYIYCLDPETHLLAAIEINDWAAMTGDRAWLAVCIFRLTEKHREARERVQSTT